MAGLGRPPAPRAAMPAWKREILERKRAKLAALGAGPGPGAAPAGPAEQLVLAESLGPLRENPFMRLESERRRGARPAPQLLELYRRVPGVRTIRADNILIIEAAPGCPAPPAGPARIRADEVLVYEAPPPAGRVSRLLEKFDPPAAPRRRGSPERARPPPPAPRAPPPPPPAERAARLQPARPADGAGPGSRRGEFVQKTGSNSFTVHPRGLHRGAAPEPRPGPACAPASAPPGPGDWKPKAGTAAPPAVPPPSPGTPSATAAAPSPASATPSQRRWVSAATSANDSFEILPAPTPDLEAIPSGDLQARALASLRVNSRNSFVFVPKRKASEAAAPPRDRQAAAWAARSPEPGAQPGSGDAASAPGRSPSEAAAGPWGAGARPATTLTDGAARGGGLPSPPPFLPAAAEAEPVQSDRAPGLAKNGREPGLPVTYIDEVDSEDEGPQEAKLPCPGAGASPRHLPHPARPGHTAELQHRGGNTFVVVPKRKPAVLQEQPCGPANGQPQPREAEEPQGEAGGLLGTVLKKRYPTVHEIEVIGGYLALQKSCLTKAGSSRKKMKISFNDKSLHTTFEYPSESSLEQDEEAEHEDGGDEDDEDGEGEGEGSGPERPFALFLPRATFMGSVGPERPGGSSGLSSYTPKHSVAFSRWQEQALEQAAREAEPPPGEVTLTPASHDDLSDFRSEPALYF